MRLLLGNLISFCSGRLMITAGNGITSDCRIESLEALLDETYHYGLKKFL